MSNWFTRIFRGGKSASDPLGHLSDDQKRSVLDLGRGYLLFALQGRKTNARSMDMSSDSPAKKIVSDLTDEQLEWLVDVANMEQEATNAGNSGNHSHAIKLFEKVVEKAPWNSIALMSLGVQHAFQRNGKKAIELLEQAARIDPSNSQIRGNLEAVRRDFG
jgi:tetratricopeptide (TPR) repeat protein